MDLAQFRAGLARKRDQALKVVEHEATPVGDRLKAAGALMAFKAVLTDLDFFLAQEAATQTAAVLPHLRRLM